MQNGLKRLQNMKMTKPLKKLNGMKHEQAKFRILGYSKSQRAKEECGIRQMER